MRQTDLNFVIWVVLAHSHFTYAQTYYYYTGGSTVINSNSCPVSACTQCARGFYNKDCGMDAPKLNGQNCVACSNLPSNADWLPWGPLPDGIASNSSICRSACIYRYHYDALGNCVRGNCTVSVTDAELEPLTDYPECSIRCKAGYIGSSALNPTSCSS